MVSGYIGEIYKLIRNNQMAGKGKTHRGIQKRVKITATGKITRKRAGKSHLLSNKSGKQLRRLRSTKTVPAHITKQLKRELTKG